MKQTMEYEWRLTYCEKCQRIGHICNKEGQKKQPSVKTWKLVEDKKEKQYEKSKGTQVKHIKDTS